MEIELYAVINRLDTDNGIKREMVGNRVERAQIRGKQLRISTTNDDFKPDFNHFYIECGFSCNFDLPFDVRVLVKEKKRKLNTEIIYTNTIHGKDITHKYYSYLTCRHRLKLKWQRKMCWVQQPSNIKWMVGTILAILAILATICISK